MTDLKACRVLVTATSYGINDPRLCSELGEQVGEAIYNPAGRPLTSAELIDLLPEMDGMIAGLDHLDRAALASTKRLKIIARYGVGVDRVDLDAAQQAGIVVTNTPGANTVSVAELTVGMALCLARSIPTAISATRTGGWPRISGAALEGKTFGLIGFGAIGKAVARRLSTFDCTLLACDPVPDTVYAQQVGVELTEIEDVLRQSDFLSLHLPVTPETRLMVNAEFLAQMKRGAYLINTARGELIDEGALYDALQSGRIKGAALDVFQSEPPDADNPLLALPQVMVTPHTGSHSDSATNRMGWTALRDCLAVLSGESPAHRVV